MTDGQLFSIDQEVTPLHNSGTYAENKMFGNIYHVSEYIFHHNQWFIQLKEIPPRERQCPCGCGASQRLIEWWPQIAFAPVISDRDLSHLLCEIELATLDVKPVIICEPA